MELAEETGLGPPAVGSADGNEGLRSRAAETAEMQRREQRQQVDGEQQQALSEGIRSTGQPQMVNAGTNAMEGGSDSGSGATQQESRTPLQRLRDAIRRRFGQEAVRSKDEITRHMEYTAGTGTETPEQRRLRLGKAPMEPQDLNSQENLQTQAIPAQERRSAPTPPTVQYPQRAAEFTGRTSSIIRPVRDGDGAEPEQQRVLRGGCGRQRTQRRKIIVCRRRP